MAGGDHPMCAFDLALLVSLFWLEFKVIILIFSWQNKKVVFVNIIINLRQTIRCQTNKSR